jgi:prepilin-type N-terminal cleavage/methylation domain-containing protein
MSIQKKLYKGFTLIELMVVIVIIGILAAIAIPKLFGVSAKAKASEVGPAAGTWTKLQQAFIAETGNIGSFAKIAYTPPGAGSASTTTGQTGNFTYNAETLLGTSVSGTAATDMTNTGSVGWKATTPGLGGDCKTTSTWAVAMGVDAVPSVTPPTDPGCLQLTPNFEKLK